ncbi:Sporulation initiation inhibitor protein soj [Desulforamulus hydrothermalis Lam5 = DSM 18033]|uniref:Sporulation initiation inhibitor protein Soj n=1 Tax=Desulforamulus hydrothermalis Lam5 = DSM 18033 TaxID=1121428 RepID=K8DZ73_9FIRM|nr:Sporulation initiation inhibitor protein soj [Desulforamulus hydrothermalis Lam5 = DSM 18033]SHH45187.1 chromosome partitioning protein [Desulforamulus hydrothermalis Lam5 = DSM 18033]
MSVLGKIICIANQKGGVAKTTTAVNIGASLAMMGQPVLLVDIDPQGNASSGLGIDKSKLERCIYDVLINEIPAEEVLISTDIRNLHLLPSTIQLAGAEVEMVSLMAREQILKRALAPLKERYQYIIIDCPPSLGLLTLNALAAADSVLIPIQCEFYALEGVGQLMNTIQLVQKHLNPGLKIEGVLLTMFDARLNLSIQVVDEVKKVFGNKVYKNIIPRNVRLSEAPSHGIPVVIYDPKSRGAEAYRELAKEVMGID